MFENLRKEVLKDSETRKATAIFYINHGYCESWSEENRKNSNPDNGLQRYATDTTWNNYKTGKITREKAITLTERRASRQIDKDTEKQLAKLDTAAAAEDINNISVSVEFIKNRTWGSIPHAEIFGSRWTKGSASGCGYDKESAAVAEAMNSDPAIMKILYTIKENGLAEGKTSDSATACTGHDNRHICGYGAGYSVIPYFEGGVGVECFWSILKKAGYNTTCNYGKHYNHYNISK